MSKNISAKFLIAFVSGIISALTGNSRFPNSDTVLDPLKIKFDEFKTAWEAAQVGTREQKLIAQKLKAELQQVLKTVCDFVNYVAKGDRAMLSTTNFQLNKDSRTNVVLSPVKNFEVTYGNNAGEMLASFKKEEGTTAVSYEYTYDEVPGNDSKWVAISSGKRSCNITGLTPGRLVTFRICIAGPRNQSIYSNMISKVAGSGQ